jgi:membrane protein
MVAAHGTWAGVVGVIRRALARAKHLKERLDGTHVGRALHRFSTQHGNVLAGGIAYHSLMSIAAGVVLAVTIASAVVGGTNRYRNALFEFLGSAVPGIVEGNGSEGLINPDSLRPTPITGIVGVIALVVLLNTATRYLAGLRAAERTMLGRAASSPLAGKLRDMVALVAIAVVVIVGAGLQVASSRAATAIGDVGAPDGVSEWGIRGVATGVGFIADAAFVAVVLMVLGRAHARRLILVTTIVGAALVIGVIRQLSSLLVAGVADNAVLAPFAAIITLLIFVDFVARILLIAGAWIGAVSTPDDEGASNGEYVITTDSDRSRRRSSITTRRATSQGKAADA